MANFDFRNMIFSLEQIGFLDVLLPFILIFTLIFAVLQKSKILGKDKDGKPRKQFNVIIALVLGLGAVIPHVTNRYPSQDADVVNIINKALPNVSLVVVGIVMVLLIIGIFGKELDIGGSSIGGWVTILSVIVVAIIFAVAAGIFDRTYLPSWLYFIYDPQLQALIVALIVFWLIISFITKSDDEGKKKEDSWLKKELGAALKNS